MADVDFEEAAPWHCFQPERPKRAACSCCNCAHCGTDEGRQRIQTDGRAGPPRRPHRSEGRACPAPQATTRDPARRPCAHGPRVPSPAHVAAHAPPASPSAAPAPDRALDRRAARPARLPRRSPPGILRRLQDLQRLLDHLPEPGVGLAGQLLGYAPDLKGALPDLCQTRTAATSILRSLMPRPRKQAPEPSHCGLARLAKGGVVTERNPRSAWPVCHGRGAKTWVYVFLPAGAGRATFRPCAGMSSEYT